MPNPADHAKWMLLTGGTGLLGTHLLTRLLHASVPVAVLARNRAGRSAVRRVDQLIQPFGRFENLADRMVVVPGDLAEPGLGLSAADLDWLGHHIGTVLHAGASLSFRPASESPNGEPFRTNVEGTRSLIHLAESWGVRDFHYVSTAYVCGRRQGTVLETETDVGQTFANDYERSKLQAEEMLRRSVGFDSVTIYRPSIVVDSTGLAPLSIGQTIYGAFETYQRLVERFGLPGEGQWFDRLGFSGHESKNIVDASWVAEILVRLLTDPTWHGQTYHLTAKSPTSIAHLEKAFRGICQTRFGRRPGNPQAEHSRLFQSIAKPYVQTFQPYFGDDPAFDRRQTDRAIAAMNLPESTEFDADRLQSLITTATFSKSRTSETKSGVREVGEEGLRSVNDPLVIVGFDVNLPGAADAEAYAELLWQSRCSLATLPEDRCDASLYFDPQRGRVGKTYTQLGGVVDESWISDDVRRVAQDFGRVDPCHLQFATVVQRAWRDSGIDKAVEPTHRTGVYVGHSGGTKLGGPLAMATLADAATQVCDDVHPFAALDETTRSTLTKRVTDRLRLRMPEYRNSDPTRFEAYTVAALAARLIDANGIREVVDAACASSLVALQHAASAIEAGRLDHAVVGGATYNNVDNAILFSQSQACSDQGCQPFDDRASGLVSSEGYVAVVVTKRSIAEQRGLNIHAEIVGIGQASDGRGKGLWAPRTEGQQLAIRRATPDDRPLAVDYVECHATSTQVGDATELVTLSALRDGNAPPLRIGSVKSNLGHTLEAAGLVGLVKVMLAMRHESIPATIDFQTPTRHFDWSAGKLEVVGEHQPWLARNQQPRTAGVNAFGIGGLNAHVAVRQSSQQQPSTTKDSPVKAEQRASNDEVVIVGRGVVLPGAFNLRQFAQCMDQGQSQIAEVPEDRWQGVTTAADIPHRRGGCIIGYRFDGQSIRIPPKQVRLANPAQMMLIDAVRQAMTDSLPDESVHDFDRRRTSVVIGTPFGGEFSNQLQVGMRVPEICQVLREEMRRESIDDDTIGNILDRYRTLMLDRFPAILDETGGFTASTLASRIAKTFDLMGGACAVDADDASGMLALMTAADQLRQGVADTVICGVAHRSLDQVAYQQLNSRGQLLSSGDPAEIPVDCDRVLPGEGVAVLILQRKSHADRGGRKSFGRLSEFVADSRSCHATRDPDVASRGRQSKREMMAGDAVHRDIVRRFGYLAGGHALVRLLAATLDADKRSTGGGSGNLDTPNPLDLAAYASDGFGIRARFYPTTIRLRRQPTTPPQRHLSDTTKLKVNEAVTAPRPTDDRPVVAARSDAPKPLLWSADDDQELVEGLLRWQRQPAAALSRCGPVRWARHTVGLVTRDASELPGQIEKILSAWKKGRRVCVLDRANAFIWTANPDRRRSAWLFPGQGSQDANAAGRILQDGGGETLAKFDAWLVQSGQASIRERMHDPRQQLGKDVWWTQIWMLAASVTFADRLNRLGLRPDIATGHSFGECGAALYTGAMEGPQAIRFAKQRSDAILAGEPSLGQLLSVRATPSEVAGVLRATDAKLTITHQNTPVQTVVAGAKSDIQSAMAEFTKQGFASVVIPVPAAFHTTQMEPARRRLQQTFARENLRPPFCPLLSAISLRYLAEPDDILRNLIDQLTEPVMFVSAIERLMADGCGLLLEVGPSDVLTRLARATAGEQALCIASDGGDDLLARSELIRLASATVAASDQPLDHDHRFTASKRVEVLPPDPQQKSGTSNVEIVDVTKPGRPRLSTNAVDSVTDRRGGRERGQSSVQRLGAIPDASVRSTGAANEFSTDRKDVTSFLLETLIDLTGYSADVIDSAADLEAELGVDSIKKAQLIGELIDWAGLSLEPGQLQLGDYVTLNDIAGLVERPHGDTTTDSTTATATAMVKMQNPIAVRETATTAKHTVSSDTDSLAELMVDFVVDQTGYSPDIIDMDADLEAELGVDSIKKAQLLGELYEHFRLHRDDEPGDLPTSGLKLADFTSLRDIHDFVCRQVEEKKKQSNASEIAQTTRVRATSQEPPGRGTHRFVLKTVNAPLRAAVTATPPFTQDAIVLGDNAVADAICHRIRRDGVTAHRPTGVGLNEIDDWLDQAWHSAETPHLFIATPHDEQALSEPNPESWALRREAAWQIPFRICQRWMQRMIQRDLMDTASLVTLVRLGGDFGLDASHAGSSESGGMAGLTKAMLIEAWMRGHRQTPMLVVDQPDDAKPEDFVDAVWDELATPSHDQEVILDGTTRRAVDAEYRPLDADDTNSPTTGLATRRPKVTRGGTWVVSGGGRGITAMTAMELAERYDLTLHLLGTTERSPVSDAEHRLAKSDRTELRRQVMRRAQENGESASETWRHVEKSIEIDQTLRACEARSIRATYHRVDVSDADAVRRCLAEIRHSDGPIRGILHGAGAGQDARFDRKRPEKVAKCVAAKVDGCLHLADATRNDPLEWFIGFGSISGRFGANGHTDYSLANDMLAKCIGQWKRVRSDVRCVTFHWHAWGDVGMAAKPEAKLALQMIGLDFMPASEGLRHFMNEIEHGGEDAEVLITDRDYVRRFFAQRHLDDVAYPMLFRESIPPTKSLTYSVTLDPAHDPFLAEHRVGGLSTLPFVVAIEMMAEAARHSSGGAQIMACKNLRADQALKFADRQAIAVELIPDADGRWNLHADLRRRDGRMVQRQRKHFSGTFVTGDADDDRIDVHAGWSKHDQSSWREVRYASESADIYHGGPLRTLRDYRCDPEFSSIEGRLITPSPVEFGGVRRPVGGWVLPCAVMDGCLYAAAVLAYHRHGKTSLPVAFDSIRIGRRPQPGEPLIVRWRWIKQDDRGMMLSGDLIGQDGTGLLRFTNYRMGYIR